MDSNLKEMVQVLQQGMVLHQKWFEVVEEETNVEEEDSEEDLEEAAQEDQEEAALEDQEEAAHQC